MEKREVELILITVKAGESEALNMKIYKDGTLCRRGMGSFPEIRIGALSFTNSSSLFSEMMEQVPQELLDDSFFHTDENITKPLEYIVAFYGVNENGLQGEQATWKKNTGIRLLLDMNTTFQHPIFLFVDSFAMDAAEKTNSWYFDVLVNVIYKRKAIGLPQTIIATPQTEEECRWAFNNYIIQMHKSYRKWDLTTLAKDKVYLDAIQRKEQLQVKRTGSMYSFEFSLLDKPVSKTNATPEAIKKWWQFWS